MKKMILLFTAAVLLTACDVIKQVESMQMLSKCEFRISTISDIQLAGVNVSDVKKISDINPLDALQITNAWVSNQLPLKFNLNLEIRNPNSQPASMNRLDWILFIDDMQMLEGAVIERFVAGAGETRNLPVMINFNLAEVLKGESKDKIIGTALGLIDGTGKSARVMVKLKPSVMVGQQTIMYPGWMEVRHEFTAQ